MVMARVPERSGIRGPGSRTRRLQSLPERKARTLGGSAGPGSSSRRLRAGNAYSDGGFHPRMGPRAHEAAAALGALCSAVSSPAHRRVRGRGNEPAARWGGSSR